jgi:ketosteroid isomerase-like protein
VPDALPTAIEMLIQASRSNDMKLFMEPWADDALLSDSHRKYWGREPIRRWASIEWTGDSVTVTEVRDISIRGEDVVMHAVLDGAYDTEGLPIDYVCAFLLKIHDGQIVRLLILPVGGRRLGKMTQTRMASTCFSAPMPGLHLSPSADMKGITDATELPQSVAAVLGAIRDKSLDAFMAAFDEDALVNDKHRTFRGADAVARWASAEILGENLDVNVLDATEHYGEVILTATFGGGFDRKRFDSFVVNGSMAVLHGGPAEAYHALYFTLRDGRISQLIITPIDGSSPIATDETPMYVPYP